MKPERFEEGRFEYGQSVRVTRNIRNDGTFLQDQGILTVHFLSHGGMLGCRPEELISADEPWNPSRFEFRDKVVCKTDLVVQGNILFPQETEGEVYKILREDKLIQYPVAFPSSRILHVPALTHPESFIEPEL
ncbi:MAG: nitrogen fixation protein NifZ [Methylobacter sp.]|nr:MAG: nitrogen fixation protein NifZ [Methylobacter sp.]PPD24305.1 MAG: nitrogen fixation protein NifZ [Methylobacter sp.]PPD35440.1 MAG: nitrogen fixation protein NifZ [Methylomonas sp.]